MLDDRWNQVHTSWRACRNERFDPIRTVLYILDLLIGERAVNDGPGTTNDTQFRSWMRSFGSEFEGEAKPTHVGGTVGREWVEDEMKHFEVGSFFPIGIILLLFRVLIAQWPLPLFSGSSEPRKEKAHVTLVLCARQPSNYSRSLIKHQTNTSYKRTRQATREQTNKRANERALSFASCSLLRPSLRSHTHTHIRTIQQEEPHKLESRNWATY